MLLKKIIFEKIHEKNPLIMRKKSNLWHILKKVSKKPFVKNP